jgi:hypothetical protein
MAGASYSSTGDCRSAARARITFASLHIKAAARQFDGNLPENGHQGWVFFGA